MYLTKFQQIAEETCQNMKKYEEIWIKIKNLIRSTKNKAGYYDRKYIKIKSNSDDN